MYFNWLYRFIEVINSGRGVKDNFCFIYVKSLLVYRMMFFIVDVYCYFVEFCFKYGVFSVVFYVVGVFIEVFNVWNMVLLFKLYN